MKKGDLAKQVIHPIEGVVIGKQFLEDSDIFQFCLEYTGADGEVHQKWFDEGELEVVEPEAPKPAKAGN
jgi:hypothetical protein